MNKLSVQITQQVAGPARLELWDASGKLLIRQDRQLSAGANQVGWDDIKQAGVVPGVYILHIISRGQDLTRKILVL